MIVFSINISQKEKKLQYLKKNQRFKELKLQWKFFLLEKKSIIMKKKRKQDLMRNSKSHKEKTKKKSESICAD